MRISTLRLSTISKQRSRFFERKRNAEIGITLKKALGLSNSTLKGYLQPSVEVLELYWVTKNVYRC